MVPLDATRLLIDVGAFVDSVDTKSPFRHHVEAVRSGYSKDLATIIDSFESFIKQANQSFPELGP